MSQWLLDDSGRTASSSDEYQSAASGVESSSGSSAPGMSFRQKGLEGPDVILEDRIARVERHPDTVRGKNPKPSASSGPPHRTVVVEVEARTGCRCWRGPRIDMGT